jgi:hypothetical protein
MEDCLSLCPEKNVGKGRAGGAGILGAGNQDAYNFPAPNRDSLLKKQRSD